MNRRTACLTLFEKLERRGGAEAKEEEDCGWQIHCVELNELVRNNVQKGTINMYCREAEGKSQPQPGDGGYIDEAPKKKELADSLDFIRQLNLRRSDHTRLAEAGHLELGPGFSGRRSTERFSHRKTSSDRSLGCLSTSKGTSKVSESITILEFGAMNVFETSSTEIC